VLPESRIVSVHHQTSQLPPVMLSAQAIVENDKAKLSNIWGIRRVVMIIIL